MAVLNVALQPSRFGASMIILMGVLLFCAIFLPSIGRTRQQDAKFAAEYGSNVAVWQRWMGSWERLFYCETCDSVYDPGTGRVAPSTEMASIL